MKVPVPVRRLLGVAALASAVVAVPAVTSGPVAAAACSYCAGGEYHPLTPARIYDSRPAAKSLGPDEPTFDVPLLGLGGVPASGGDVLAVALSVTIDAPSQAGWLSVYPTGSSSTSSVLNFSARQTVPNLAIVGAGTNGKITVKIWGASAGTANVMIDVLGWFSTSSYTAGTPGNTTDERGARLIAVDPGRIVDTRQAGFSPIGAGGVLRVPIRGASVMGGGPLVPNDPSVVGALVNVTAVAPSSDTWMSVVPDAPSGPPSTSNLNLSRGRVQANLVMAPVGADGAVYLYNDRGSTNVIVDVLAYMKSGVNDDTRAGRVIPLSAPFRAFDTRQAAFQSVPLGPGQAEDWSFSAFAASVNIGGTAVGNQSALIGNLTNAQLTRQYPTVGVQSYLTVYPSDAVSMPIVSSLNSYESAPVPNMTLVKYGTDYKVRFFNAAGYAHYLLDVFAVVLAD